MSLTNDVIRVENLLGNISQNYDPASAEGKVINDALSKVSSFLPQLTEALDRLELDTAANKGRFLALTSQMETALDLVASQGANPVLRTIAKGGADFLRVSSTTYAAECAEALANAPLVDLGSAFLRVIRTLEAVEANNTIQADIKSKELRSLFASAAWPSGHAQELRDKAQRYWQTCQNSEASVVPPAGFSFTGTWQAFRDEIEQPLTTSDIVSRTGSYQELTTRINVVNTQLAEELAGLDAIVGALKIVNAFLGIALAVVSLAM